MREILENLQIKDLVTYAHTHRTGRETVSRIVRGRYLTLLQFFITPKYLHSTIELLERTGSVIGGCAALWLILSPCSWTPDNLDIITPVFKASGVSWHLEWSRHTPAHHSPTIDIAVSHNDRDLIHTIRKITGFGAGATVTIIESMTEDIFLPVLAATATYQMNVITWNEILCFYSHSTLQYSALSFHQRVNLDNEAECAENGVNLLYTNGTWTRPCREECPCIWRRICGLRDMGIFAVGDGTPVKFKLGNRAKESHWSWTLGFACENPDCPNY